jgi:hypothetical protein
VSLHPPSREVQQLAGLDPALVVARVEMPALYSNREPEGGELALPYEPVDRVGGQPNIAPSRFDIEPFRFVLHRQRSVVR